jgi:hypothetical protein
MRQITQLLMETRCEQLKTAGKEERITEVRDMFQFLDNALNGLRFSGNGFDGPESRLREVMTSDDFDHAIGEFVQRQVIPGYQTKRFAFEPLVKPDTLPNFMNVTRYQRRAGLDNLEYVAEKGEPRPGSVVDATTRQYRVYRWEKQFDFSMEVIANDDLGYFADMSREMGIAARRTLEQFVSRMYTNATTIARLVGLGALYSTTGRLTTARISTARMAFNQRVDTRGDPISVPLTYLVYHSGLVDTVRTIRASQLVPELATNAANVIAGDFTPIEDPYIVGVAPNLPWYAFCRWQDSVVPFVLARWSNLPAPMLVRRRSDIESFTSFSAGGGNVSPLFGDFATGNIVIKVADAWGTYTDAVEGNLFDFRGAYYSAGTAA